MTMISKPARSTSASTARGAALLVLGLSFVACGSDDISEPRFSGFDLEEFDVDSGEGPRPRRNGGDGTDGTDGRPGADGACNEPRPDGPGSDEDPSGRDPCSALGGMCLPGRVFEANGTCPTGEPPIWELECAPFPDGSPLFCCKGPERPSDTPCEPPTSPDEATPPGEPSTSPPDEPCEPPTSPDEATPPGEPSTSPPDEPGQPPRPSEPPRDEPGPNEPGDDGSCPDLGDASVRYVSTDLEVCAVISYTCPSSSVPFDGLCGCGCVWFEEFPSGG